MSQTTEGSEKLTISQCHHRNVIALYFIISYIQNKNKIIEARSLSIKDKITHKKKPTTTMRYKKKRRKEPKPCKKISTELHYIHMKSYFIRYLLLSSVKRANESHSEVQRLFHFFVQVLICQIFRVGKFKANHFCGTHLDVCFFLFLLYTTQTSTHSLLFPLYSSFFSSSSSVLA
jgi:hypothetical protein